jgi:DtxR family Mn-dependent transcriptional regulator
MAPTAPNPTTEDYVKRIYKLQRHGETVSTSALAASLSVADASVTGMVKKLSAKGLVRYQRYKGVELTASGLRVALKTLRRHRLWEMFLVQQLGFSWDKIHVEAERLEHATSDELEHRLDKLLGFPRVDPHGDPIPDAHGAVAGETAMPLTSCAEGDRVSIRRVSDASAGTLQHAAEMGLHPGCLLEVVGNRSDRDQVTIVNGPRRLVVSRKVAAAVYVTRER